MRERFRFLFNRNSQLTLLDQLTEKRNANLNPIVKRSWERCLSLPALNPMSDVHETIILRERVRDSIEGLGSLYPLFRSQVEQIFRAIGSSGHAVILADAKGIIIDFVVGNGLQDLFTEQGLVRGADWSEGAEGTNGVGTAILEKRSLTILRNQHYLATNESLTCTGAPVFDENGDVLALLDISSVGRRDAPDIIAHTRAMLEMSARLVSRRNFQEKFSDKWLVRFHPDPERVGLLEEGMIAVEEDGRILAADNQAMAHLGLSDRAVLKEQRLDEMFGKSFDQAVDLQKSERPESLGAFYARMAAPASCIKKPNRKPRITYRRERLDDYLLDDFTRDPALETSLVEKAKKLVYHDVPLLITGETGSGKEVFARALHNSSPRKRKPFVAINCAALPQGLIEGELFGYRPGAFTGAHPEGFRGRLLEANGGTLFLDEIGDMPLDLQSRLLRVLETRKVTPLGGVKEYDLDLQVLSATNHNLEMLLKNGEFRSDLYYRISGFEFYIPGVRDRSDVEHLVRMLEPGMDLSSEVCFTEAARSAILRYSWPGNVRELKNVLKTARVLSDGDPIDVDHLRLHIPDPVQKDDRLDMSGHEKVAIRRMLGIHNNNVTRTARALGISRSTLYRKMVQYGISRK